ncbi:4Fe-4S dicluster domain-containing protein [Carboxydocella thermautotrophica]|nr:4Fe-4S dicluster domain-containing protein [Carboxydocella thermautotrophica]
MPAQIDSGKCLRRYRNQACRVCLENCPGQAIQLVNGLPVVEKQGCQNCGFCRAQCPTAAASGSAWLQAPVLACQETGPVEGAINIPCLAVLTVEEILDWLEKHGEERLEIHCGDCESCACSNWRIYAEKTRQQVKDWLRATGWQERCQFKISPKEKKLGRRALFSWLSLKLLEKVEQVLKDSGENKPRPSWSNLLPRLPEAAWQRSAEILAVDPGKCDQCGVCIRVCPQQAFFSEVDGKTRRLLWQGSKCRDCHVCSGLCPVRALSWQPGSWKERIKPIILKEIPVIYCQVCGQVISSTREGKCPACIKKQNLLQEINFTFTA